MHVSSSFYVPKLQWISQRFVVLWDEKDKRGWLLRGISALLHLLRASLKYAEMDDFKGLLISKSEQIVEPSSTSALEFAINVLTNKDNMQLPIYPDKDGPYRLENRVEELYERLEKMIEHQIDVAGQNGVELKTKVRKHLEGWDFKDLAKCRDPIYPRVATLPTIGKGWVDLIRSIQAVTLFGRGFGDMIQPVQADMCPRWTNLPKERYYLAACVADLKEIMELNGDPNANPLKLTNTIVWHNPDQIFDPCRCTRQSQKGHSDFVQILWPAMISRRLPKRDPIQLEGCGAVIFGHSTTFRWHWRDEGDPVEGDPVEGDPIEGDPIEGDAVESDPPEGEHQLLSSESELRFQDSGIGPSLDSSGADHSESSPESDSQLPRSEELTSGIPESNPTHKRWSGLRAYFESRRRWNK